MRKIFTGIALIMAVILFSVGNTNAQEEKFIPDKNVKQVQSTKSNSEDLIVQNTKSKNGWVSYWGEWYYLRNGYVVCGEWIKDGGYWYYVDDYTGIMLRDGFYIIRGQEYCFNTSGKMQIGWIQCEYEWRYRWAYAGSSGAIYKNKWFKQNNIWYYFDEIGLAAQDDVYSIDKKYYYFNNSGAMKTGWIFNGYSWYYGDSSGALYTNRWYKEGSKWYYFEDYWMCENYAVKIDRTWYYFNKSGHMQNNGWVYDGYDWYYATSSGALYANRWYKEGEKWYYFEECFMARDDIYSVGNKYYYFNGSGHMRSNGWIYNGHEWFYAKSSGELYRNAWLQLNGKWYYFDDVYMLQARMSYIGNETYYFDESGIMQTGWTYIYDDYIVEVNWYYFDSNGKLVRNQYVDGYWVNEDGYSSEYNN